MSRRWNWDFEDDPARRRTGGPRPPSAPPDGASPRSPARTFRRRRVTAALGLVLALVLLAVLLSGSGHRAATPAAAGARAGAAHAGEPHRQLDEGDAVSSVLAYTPFIKEGSEAAPEVALTFDDGPGPYTPAVLAALEQAKAPATFFAIGRMERYFGGSTVRELRDGDVVGDHTEDHRPLATLSAHEQHEQIFEQLARLELLGLPRPHLFRPPYGSFNAVTMRELRAFHLLMVLWSVDSGDYEQPGVSAIVQRALAGARPGAILLLHDGGGNRSQTAAALPLIIRELRARGLRLVTVPELLVDDPPPHGQPLPPNLSGE
jgi:peptidoglycan-N-acetylglucosamine deacetylase